MKRHLAALLLFAATAAGQSTGDIRGLQAYQAGGTWKNLSIAAPSNGHALIFSGDATAPWSTRFLTAADLTSGTIDAARLPGLTGDVTSSAGTVATTIATGAVTTGKILDGTMLYRDASPSQFLPYDARNYALPAFAVRTTIAAIAGVSNGISGVTYNPRSGTIFVVRNVSAAAGNIYELTTEGILLRTITNSNFIDTEGICWVGWDATNSADVFLIAEEDHTTAANESSISLVRLTTGATTLDRTAAGNATATTGYGGDNIGNLGVEGVTYDPSRGTIYYTAEKRTASGDQNTQGSVDANIYTRTVTVTGTLAIGAESSLCSIATLFSGATLTDISDIAYDLATDTILLLSDESDKVVRVSRAGTLIEQLATPGFQPEGLAIHPAGTELYVSGENAEYYRYALGIHGAGLWLVDNTAYAAAYNGLTNTAPSKVAVTPPGKSRGRATASVGWRGS